LIVKYGYGKWWKFLLVHLTFTSKTWSWAQPQGWYSSGILPSAEIMSVWVRKTSLEYSAQEYTLNQLLVKKKGKMFHLAVYSHLETAHWLLKNFGMIGAKENFLILSFKVLLINGSSWFSHHGHVLEHCRLLGRNPSSPFRPRGDSDTPSQMWVSSEVMGKLFNCHHVFI
jgi:hypothetical protein